MIVHRMKQRSPEWYAVRCGKITSSHFQTLAVGRPDSVEKLCVKIATERITGVPCESPYRNAAMQHGIEMESVARLAYETTTFNRVEEVGFVEVSDYLGISPDGLVGDDGGLEIKCPQPHTHLSYLMTDAAWLNYKWQIQGALWVTDWKWWDFVSFCPQFPPDQQLKVERVGCDSTMIKIIDSAVGKARIRIQDIVELL